MARQLTDDEKQAIGNTRRGIKTPLPDDAIAALNALYRQSLARKATASTSGPAIGSGLTLVSGDKATQTWIYRDMFGRLVRGVDGVGFDAEIGE